MKSIAGISLIVCITSLIAACRRPISAPSRTVKDFIEKINKDDVEGPFKLLSTNYINGPGGANFARSVIVFSMGAFHNAGGVKSVETVSEDISGNSAKVTVRLIYNTGKHEELAYKLVKEDNEWRIDAF